MIFCEEFFKSVHHLFNLTDLSTKIKNSDGLNLSEVMMMKSKKFYSNLDVCVNFNNVAKKNVADTAIPVRNKSSFCITPLAAAVCLIISGMAFSSQVWADTHFSSPKTVSGEETLSSGLNSSSSSGATVTITSTGILNFPDSDTGLSGSEDSNSITSYGTINGAPFLSTIYGGVGVTVMKRPMSSKI